MSVILLTGGGGGGLVPWGGVWSQGGLQFFLGGSGPGGSPIFRGVSNFWGGGCLQFLGGCLQFFGGVLQFFGGVLQIFFFFQIFFLFFFKSFFPKISSGMHQPPPPRDGQCTAGTHPTGMHSCSIDPLFL